jgi:hypothetical protein
MKMEKSIPKCWHIKFRHWGITQKKEYNIHNMAKSLKSRMLEEFHQLIISNKLELIYGMVKAGPRDILCGKSFASIT